MLTNDLDAASAAFEVGYESASQFNREYKRFFGQPPIRDIKALRTAKSWRSLPLNAELLGCPRGGLFSTVANSPMHSLSSRQAGSYGLVRITHISLVLDFLTRCRLLGAYSNAPGVHFVLGS